MTVAIIKDTDLGENIAELLRLSLELEVVLIDTPLKMVYFPMNSIESVIYSDPDDPLGRTMARFIRTHPEFHSIPCLFLVNDFGETSSPDNLSVALRLPFEPDYFIDIIKEWSRIPGTLEKGAL